MDPKKIILPGENSTTTPSKIHLPNEAPTEKKEIILPNQKSDTNKTIILPGQENNLKEIELPLKKDNEGSESEEIPRLEEDTPTTPNISNQATSQPSETQVAEGPKPGDKVDTGKQLNEKGEVEDSSTKKTLKAVGRGAAAYFTGGESIGKDSQILNARPVDKTIGVVSDQLEKVPGVEEISKELDEAGIADGVNDALDTVGNIKNGDVAGAIESAKKLKEDTKKGKKALMKKVAAIAAPAAFIFFLSTIFIIIISGPNLGGFMDVVESEDEEAAEIGEVDYVENYGYDNQEQSANMASSTENFENLSKNRQDIILAAASAVSAKVQYNYGSHPNGPGLRGIPSAGLDCAGFVQWALWTGLGGNPGYLTTQAISDRIGKDFIRIEYEDLLPGDIGLKREGGSYGDNYNHTGIYAGDDYWYHASSGKRTHQVVKSKYQEFTIYLRYVGVN